MGFLPFPPWIIITGMDSGKFQIDGVQYKILSTICSIYNISLEAHMGRDHRFGIIYPNGSYDGMIAQLVDKDIDLILGPWVLDERRILSSKMTESTVFFTSEIVLLASSGQSEPSSFFGFLYTFDGEIWFALMGGFVVLIMLAVFADLLHENRLTSSFRALSSGIKRKLTQYFWIYLAALLSEGSARNPTSGVGKNILALWLLSIMILMNAFTGQFKSILMVRSKTGIIDTVHQLAQRTDVITYLPDGSIFSEVFELSPLEDYQKIYRHSLKYGEEGIVPPTRYLTPKLYQNIKDGIGVGVADASVVKFLLAIFCHNLTNDRSMYFVKETFFPYNFIFAFRRGLPDLLIKDMNKRIQWLYESHIINKWIEYSLRDFKKCNFEELDDSQETPLGMEHLLPLFLLQGFFLSCCSVIFLFEKFAIGFTKSSKSRVK